MWWPFNQKSKEVKSEEPVEEKKPIVNWNQRFINIFEEIGGNLNSTIVLLEEDLPDPFKGGADRIGNIIENTRKFLRSKLNDLSIYTEIDTNAPKLEKDRIAKSVEDKIFKILDEMYELKRLLEQNKNEELPEVKQDLRAHAQSLEKEVRSLLKFHEKTFRQENTS